MNSALKQTLKNELEVLLGTALSERVASGAAMAVSVMNSGSGRDSFSYSCGYTSRTGEKRRVTESTFFDLASLTKPLVTALCLLTLVQQKRIGLQSRLDDLLPLSTIPKDKLAIELWQLMSHCSGLPAHRPYFVKALTLKPTDRSEYFLQSILSEKLEYRTGSRHVYSDLGYILLGKVIEQLTGKGLNSYFEETILQVLELQGKLIYPGLKGPLGAANCVATEVCPWTRRLLCGIVHDDNCRVMGGVAGHAGLFGTAGGVMELCAFLGNVWQGRERTELFSTELLRRFLTRRDSSTWTCGFDTPSPLYSSSGSHFGPASIGHLGFTGTSFWIDLKRGISVVLLTNRVHPSRKNEKIKKLRPKVHDLIMEKLVCT